MTRSPQKSCPNLYRLFDCAEFEDIVRFLRRTEFSRQEWLEGYLQNTSEEEAREAFLEMLRIEKKERLGPLEAEAARVVTIAGGRGQYVLDGLARTKLDTERARQLLGRRDDLARSLWAMTCESALFEATENTLHMRMYRRFDRHYQTFMAEPSGDGGPESGSETLGALLDDLRQRLDRGNGYSIEKFDIPAEGDESAVEMYLLFHPDPPKSVREIDDNGNRSSIYFRPPGEAMIVYTPSTGRVHVRAGNRNLRHTIAKRFIETALGQVYSSQPVDFQAYDISRFLRGLDLELPDIRDVVILRAQVIRADISIGNLANRLSLSTTIDQDISAIIDSNPGLPKIFERAVAIRFVEIAVRYRSAGQDEAKTLDFTISDRNTSSLLSLDDPFERDLGHRLLRFWSILRDGRAPTDAEGTEVIPALLAIWDKAEDRVSGAWLLDRGVDPALLLDLGFLVLAGWEGDDLIDDEDEIGPVAAQVIVRREGPSLRVTDGHETPGGSADRYRTYRVRDDWVEQHLKTSLQQALDNPAVEALTADLLSLGTLRIDGRSVPVYLARGLDQEKVRSAVDTELRARHHIGTGLVLQAGDAAGKCLANNVLTPLAGLIDHDRPEIALVADRLRAVFRSHRLLANGGQSVELIRAGKKLATLVVPGRGTIDIPGEHRINVMERLVNAHNAGLGRMPTGELTKGMEGQSLANIFKQPLWNKLKADFVRSSKPGTWEIAI